MNKTITLSLDDLDFDAIHRAVARRQTFRCDGGRGTLLPEGGSELLGALVAEICRGWMEFMDLNRSPS